jgi:hypothetical protein
MGKSLLERQARLVEFMTSGAAIFGKPGDLPVAADLQGIDRILLGVEAQLSHAKRVQKIMAVLPRTFALLGSRNGRIVHAFAESSPPTTISRLENARQFFQFLSSGWEDLTLPPYIGDVAACEIAFARVDYDGGVVEEDRSGRPGAIRRSPAAQLLRCTYDVRQVFETKPVPTSKQAEPKRRDVRLAVATGPGASRPQVLEVVPSVFDLLAALDDWVDPPDKADSGTLIADLARSGLIEVHP